MLTMKSLRTRRCHGHCSKLLVNEPRTTLRAGFYYMNRILLRDFETGLYLDPSGTWTTNPEQAQGFPNTVLATETKLRRRLSEAFVIVVPPSGPGSRPVIPRTRTRTSLGKRNRREGV